MSGGHFSYTQHNIIDIYESIENELERQGKTVPYDGYGDRVEYEKNPNYFETYPPEVQQRLREGIEILKKAYVYAHRIDYFLSGDDGEESFLKRLDDDLNKLEQCNNTQ